MGSGHKNAEEFRGNTQMKSEDAHSVMIVKNGEARSRHSDRSVEGIGQAPDSALAVTTLRQFLGRKLDNSKWRISNNSLEGISALFSQPLKRVSVVDDVKRIAIAVSHWALVKSEAGISLLLSLPYFKEGRKYWSKCDLAIGASELPICTLLYISHIVDRSPAHARTLVP